MDQVKQWVSGLENKVKALDHVNNMKKKKKQTHEHAETVECHEKKQIF